MLEYPLNKSDKMVQFNLTTYTLTELGKMRRQAHWGSEWV
jgi:hypothetical protein